MGYLRQRKWPVWLGAVMVTALAYRAVTPWRRPELTRHEVGLAGLPPGLSGLRVVQLSDLHFGPFTMPGAIRRVVAMVNACQPDLVVLTGDFVNFRGHRYLGRGMAELKQLRSRYGVYACLGNHEHWEGTGPVLEALQSAGIHVLSNDSRPVADGLWVAAVDDLLAGQADVEAAARRPATGDAVILLSHNPGILPRVADRDWLVLAGHTHGGQVALPFLGPRRTFTLPAVRWLGRAFERLGLLTHAGNPEGVSAYRYPAGWYRDGRALMYVNRGIGVNQAQPIRINCPPEVSLFVLRPATAGQTTLIRNSVPVSGGRLPTATLPGCRGGSEEGME